MVPVALREPEEVRGGVKNGQPSLQDGLKSVFDLVLGVAPQGMVKRARSRPVEPGQVGDLRTRNHAVEQKHPSRGQAEDLVVVPKLRGNIPHGSTYFAGE